MANNYLVEYMVTRTVDGHGEFSHEQIIEKYSLVSVTNDLNEIFTDIFDEHRFNSILGIEIIKVTIIPVSEGSRGNDMDLEKVGLAIVSEALRK